MHHSVNNFEELEPRAIPEPTILKYIPDSSVPEVSLICAKPLPAKNTLASEGKSKSYANWKNQELWQSNSQISHQNFIRRSNSDSTALRNTVANRAWNTSEGFKERDYGSKFDTLPYQNRQNQAVVIHEDCCNSPTQKNVHNVCYNRDTQEQKSAFPKNRTSPLAQKSPQNSHIPYRNYESQDPASNPRHCASMQEHSCNSIKPILKNSLYKGNSMTNQRLDNTKIEDHCLRRSASEPNHQDHQCKSPQIVDHPNHVSSSLVPHCQHPISTKSDTVRDLLLLVKNQNEQIKSLQTQVAKLLKIHEENAGCCETQRSAINKSNAKSPSAYMHESSLSKNVMVASQKNCHPRSFNAHPSQESSELRYHGDTLRNTIMEKKVSIGVMTSFEFSVQNNSFLAELDHQSNPTVRDCGKNLSKPVDNWRSNMHCSRKVSAGPLDNISEGTESYVSSITKQNSNCVGTSTSENSGSRSTNGIINRIEEENTNRSSPISGVPQNKEYIEKSSPAHSNKSKNVSATPKAFENNPTYKGSPLQKQAEDSENIRLALTNNQQNQRQTNLPLRNDEKNGNNVNGRELGGNSTMPKNDYNRRYPGKPGNHQCSRIAENTIEGSFALHSSDFEVPDASPPSLDPSIHVDMREYSSDEDEEPKVAPTVGWTFYKNVVGQVNKILQQIPGSQDPESREKINRFQNDVGNEDIFDSVKTATLEQLKMLGINYAEHSQFNSEHTQKKVTFDSTYHPTVDYHANMLQSTSSISETNASMHMKELALKYLSDEQLADIAAQNQEVEATKQKYLSINGTNMSLATMNYLQRYCLVSGAQGHNSEDRRPGNLLRPRKPQQMIVMKEHANQPPGQNHTTENSTSRGGRDNILDITTLKQQPKLL